MIFSFQLFLALLPYICLLLTIWFVVIKNASAPLFLNVIKGAVFWSLAIWLETNFLSWLGLITGPIIASFWGIYFISACVLLFRARIYWRKPSFRIDNYAVCAIALCTLIVALVYPPNNYDVLTYHMPRVAHWLQNHSMAPWVSSIDRQIGMAPFNAMIALQSYGPGRLDYFVNLGQWMAFVGCIIAAAGLTGLLGGGGRRAQACAIIFAATMPAAIIQASNTESCLIVSFFLCAMAYMYLIWRQDKGNRMLAMILFGGCLGLAILSKGSAYPIALPFVCMVGWRCIVNPRNLLIQGLVAACLVVALNAPHFVRTVEGEGSMVASSERNILMRPTPGTFAVNSLYNFISNNPLLLNFGGLELWKNISSQWGVAQDDKNILPWGGLNGAKDYYVPSDPVAPNPLHSIFVLLAGVALLMRRIRLPWHYGSAVFASFALFCLVLTWHPWVARIHVSLFLLAAPACGLLISMIKNRWLYGGTLFFFYFIAIFPTLFCVERPLLPAAIVEYYRHNVQHFLSSSREAQLFNNYPTQMQGYIRAADIIAAGNPGNVGIRVGSNALEYPLWVLLNNRMTKAPHMYHAIKGESYPGYIFEFIRDGEEKQTPIRVLKNDNGNEEIIFPKKKK